MLYLALAVACSLAIGMIFKHTGRRKMDRTALLTVNYLAAVGVAGGLLMLGESAGGGGLTLTPSLLALGVGTGALLIAGFFILMVATDVAGMSLALGVMRVSVVIPFLASWIVWGEPLSPLQGVGMAVAAVAFFLISKTSKARPSEPKPVAVAASEGGDTAALSEMASDPPADHDATDTGDDALPSFNARVFGVLALTFLAGGAVDVTMKAFEETFGGSNSRFLFLLLAFGIAFLIGAAIVIYRGLRRGEWPARQTIGWGIGLGVINYGSLEFLLRAIERLPGTIVFPVNNIAIVIFAAVLGVYVWGETLSRANRAGLALAVVALVLLNL